MKRLFAVLGALVLLAGPAAAQIAPAADEGRPIVIGRSFELTSKALGQVRRINVWVPPSYAEGAKRYPVLYVIDGGEAQDFHHVSGLAQLGTISGTTAEMIVVGVETVDRVHELTYATDRPDYRKEFPRLGGAADFRRHLADEVIPFVESRWRTDGERAVMGESLAGLFIVETFLRQPGLFDRYVAVSPSLWWDEGSLAKDAPALLARHDGAERSLWLTIADEGGEMQTAMDVLVATLKTAPPKGLHWTYGARPNETHASIYHGAALDALRALYGPKPTATAAP